MAGAEQKLNWTASKTLNELNQGVGTFYLNEESDNPASQAFVINPSLGSAFTTGCKPSSWLNAYLIQEDITFWKGEMDRDQLRFCWRLTSSVKDIGDQGIYTFRWICPECLHMDDRPSTSTNNRKAGSEL
ncbi:hypothetical protein K435DRAFT_869579 [Dendrothele bispora CBS 962.96]|uniref:Uncharacterized protein n=1 Tax=Dendrothele bispora (strain CBS 962.96) TaxID=1314807 RepID=A0A4S8L8U7_DENBC|nr:hypothetical protein K435DRAFT_869579 [Dendrothele bispora CBS 962.96]